MKIFLDTIGCRLNQAEIESHARQFRRAGHEIVPTANNADLTIVNTCSVTARAASDSRAALRRANRLGSQKIIATGCWATLEPDLAASLPGVFQVVPNARKDALVTDLLSLPQAAIAQETRAPLPGAHARTRAFIKVQDGCNNTCTFCLTTLARGPSRSCLTDAILQDINAALAGGTQEIVLTAVHLAAWGKDLSPTRSLKDLLAFLLEKTAIHRLHLSSLEPWDLEPDFFSLWADPRLCRHLHLPLQSGSASVLKRMARKTTPAAYASLLTSARQAIPGVAITTDLICGFPGETADEFVETLDFVAGLHLAAGHVFPFSPRPGTVASRLPGQVPPAIAKDRCAQLRAILATANEKYRRAHLGQVLNVLWESCLPAVSNEWHLSGWAGNYLRVHTTAPTPRWNIIDPVEIRTLHPHGLEGVILPP